LDLARQLRHITCFSTWLPYKIQMKKLVYCNYGKPNLLALNRSKNASGTFWGFWVCAVSAEGQFVKPEIYPQ